MGRTQKVETAPAEMAFSRLLFSAEAPETPLPANAAEYTAIAATTPQISHAIAARPRSHSVDRSLELRALPRWPILHARQAGQAILYKSICNPQRGRNIALLSAVAFATREPASVRPGASGVRRSAFRHSVSFQDSGSDSRVRISPRIHE
jgi:hypothetical protein